MKKVRLLLISLICASSLFSTVAFANENTSIENNFSNLSSVSNIDDSFLESIDKYNEIKSRGYDELVETDTKYYKVTQDNDNNILSKENISLAEYNILNEKINNESNLNVVKNTRASTWYDNNINDTVKVMLEVYRDSSNKNKFVVCQTFAWSRAPRMSSIDAFGVRVSPTMILKKGTNFGSAQASVDIVDGNGGMQVYSENILGRFEFDSLGAGYEIKAINGAERSSGYMGIEAYFSEQSNTHKLGNVYGYYVSTRKSLSLSIDAEGKPSFALQDSAETFNTGVTISTD